jgi:hypothetical protein
MKRVVNAEGVKPMSEPNYISRKHNIAVLSVLGVLVLAALGYYFSYDQGTAEHLGDVVTVTSKPVQVPQGFEEAFKDFTGLLLVDKEKKVIAITPKGGTINLCGSGRGPECQVVMTAHAVVDALSFAGDCGRCDVGGDLTSCHLANRTYSCHKTKKPHPSHTCDCN